MGERIVIIASFLRLRQQAHLAAWAGSLFAQRLQVSGFGPRQGRASKRIRRWAEVRSTAELGATLHLAAVPLSRDQNTADLDFEAVRDFEYPCLQCEVAAAFLSGPEIKDNFPVRIHPLSDRRFPRFIR